MIKTNDFMEIMKGRRSIRNYDPAVKISKEEMTEILEEATTAHLLLTRSHGVFLSLTARKEKKSSHRLQALTKHKSQHHLLSSLYLQT